ncbi:hypothetical protein [Antiquaquibacter soli]|uniref:Uncharacterized protein n=1 Tax=Antiquaquibacter soli TaxID=3064523 RepID=A0ABT9BRE4_9MICO|nr:hypothetical protein [Protaetiibacter sp. WY-16]MDO7882371.1 hypothetical protein [Protaetiibacter sp. WY-16]
MFHRRLAILAGSSALVLALSGCSLLESGSKEPLTGIAACALGHTWQLDFEDLSAKVLAELQKEGVPATAVTAAGTQTLEWDEQGRVVLTSDFDVTVTAAPAADQTITIVEHHDGTATGAAYINGEVAIPRKWDGTGQNIETTGDNNGTPLETIPWELPWVGIDDSVGLELTCDGESLTIHPRGERITQLWTRS